MKSIIKKIPHITFLAIMIFTMNIMPFVVSAAPTDNVTGYAFSDMPNASDEISDNENHYGGRGLGFINMSGDRYGVNLGTDGKFTGYGWSEFGGYVQFNPSGKPEGGAYVDASCLAGNTACPVRGWIRFVSASNDPQSGGWDGWVKMSDSTVWSNGVVLGAPDAAKNRQMSGYAWGDDVVGWVDFSKVKVMGDWCPNIPGYDPAVPAGMIIDADGNCVPPPVCVPPLVENPAVPPIPACVCPNTLQAPVNGQCPTISTCPDGTPIPPSGVCTSVPPRCPTPAPNPNYPGMTTGTYNPACTCKGTPAQCAPVTGCMNSAYDNYNSSATNAGICLCLPPHTRFDTTLNKCVTQCTNPDPTKCIPNPKNPAPIYIET